MTRNPEALPAVVLASGSTIRREMLERAGLSVTAVRAVLGEAALKAVLRRDHADTATAAAALATEKARMVARDHPAAIVIGADQILDLDGEWLDKPPDIIAAARQLRQLSGRRHRLVSAVAVIGGEAPWQAVDTAELTMRPLGDAFIDWYLDAAGPAILGSVGAYQVEGLGVQLFERIDGDFFTILGLPLLPLLAHLRGR